MRKQYEFVASDKNIMPYPTRFNRKYDDSNYLQRKRQRRSQQQLETSNKPFIECDNIKKMNEEKKKREEKKT